MKFANMTVLGLLLCSQVSMGAGAPKTTKAAKAPPVAAAPVAAAAPAPTGFDVTINVGNVEKEEGTIFLALVDDPTDFPSANKEATLKGTIPAKKVGSTFVFKNVKAGKYAVSIFQDLNASKKLDVNFMGIPAEPYGVSGTPKFGKPKFEDCVLDFKEAKTLEVKLK